MQTGRNFFFFFLNTRTLLFCFLTPGHFWATPVTTEGTAAVAEAATPEEEVGQSSSAKARPQEEHRDTSFF